MMDVEGGTIILLIVLNMRSIKESVTFLLPIFLDLPADAHSDYRRRDRIASGQRRRRRHEIASKVHRERPQSVVGILGMLGLFLLRLFDGRRHVHRHRSRLECMPVMREPRVQTAKRTMGYMAFSLAIAAGG